MLSIGDLIDKLVIENIKLFKIRDMMHSKSDLSEEEYAILNEKMMNLNKNRSTIMNALDEKIERVFSGEEKNRILAKIKTY